LARRTGESVRLEEAAAAYRAAVDKNAAGGLDQRRSGYIYRSLGRVLTLLGQKDRGIDQLAEAIAAYDESIRNFAAVGMQGEIDTSRKQREQVVALLDSRRQSLSAAALNLDQISGAANLHGTKKDLSL